MNKIFFSCHVLTWHGRKCVATWRRMYTPRGARVCTCARVRECVCAYVDVDEAALVQDNEEQWLESTNLSLQEGLESESTRGCA